MKTLKTLIYTIFFSVLIGATNHAEETSSKGMILVLEAPLFAEKDESSRVIQYIRKNEIIYLASENFSFGPLEVAYYDDSDKKERLNSDPFYTTVDKSGNTAYILKRHVKVIYRDEREKETSVTVSHDDTEYRPPEPLPRNYPFHEKSYLRFGIATGMATNTKKDQVYNQPILKENYPMKRGFEMFSQRQLSFDPYRRLFAGAWMRAMFVTNQLETVDQSTYFEEHANFGVGPVISYDSYRTEFYRINIYCTFMYDYFYQNIYRISQTKTITTTDATALGTTQKLTLTPEIGLIWQKQKVTPDLDFFLQGAMHLGFPNHEGFSFFVGFNTFK